MEAKARRVREQVAVILGLSGDDFRNAVLAHANALSWDAKEFDEDARRRIAEVVQDSWPENGVRANIERDNGTFHFRDRGAHAWLTLAPALDIAPSAEQWADLVTSELVMTDTSSWLSRHYTEEAALRAADSCDSPSVRPWANLVGAIPTEVRIPEDVVNAIVAHVSEPTLDEPDFELWQIGDRFAREERLDELQALSEKNEQLEARLRPWRAQLGDAEAARILLEDLETALSEGKRFDRDDANWLDGVSDAALLPQLFRSLSVALLSEDDSPFGISSSIGRAIHRIGGDDAVRMYDELIASSDESRFKFLRMQRDEIVQAELRKYGQEHAVDVAIHLNVPIIDPGA